MAFLSYPFLWNWTSQFVISLSDCEGELGAFGEGGGQEHRAPKGPSTRGVSQVDVHQPQNRSQGPSDAGQHLGHTAASTQGDAAVDTAVGGADACHNHIVGLESAERSVGGESGVCHRVEMNCFVILMQIYARTWA